MAGPGGPAPPFLCSHVEALLGAASGGAGELAPNSSGATLALGVIVPAQSREQWVRRHPQAFGVLAAIESLVRRWPLLRAAGDYLVIEGVRR